MIGMDRTTYYSYEDPEREYYPLDILEKLAEIFRVPIVQLLMITICSYIKGKVLQLKNIANHFILLSMNLLVRLVLIDHLLEIGKKNIIEYLERLILKYLTFKLLVQCSRSACEITIIVVAYSFLTNTINFVEFVTGLL